MFTFWHNFYIGFTATISIALLVALIKLMVYATKNKDEEKWF